MEGTIKEKYERYEKDLKDHMHKFFENLGREKEETKEAFALLKDHIVDDKELTDEEKKKIGDQMKDLLRVVGLSGLMVLPGASVFLILSTYFKLNKYLLPSSFLSDEDKGD